MKKKILSVFLVLCLIFTLLPVSALADTTASGKCGDNLTWTLKNGTLTISGTGAMYEYGNAGDIPWYDARKELKTVVVKSGVTSICDYAFRFCSEIETATIPTSVTKLGKAAFAFGSNLKSVTIPDGVTSIGDETFFNCYSMTSVTIGSGVTSIGKSAFSGCVGLKNVNYTGTVQQWKKITVGEDNSYIDDTDIHCLNGDIIKPKYCGKNVTWTYKNGTLTISGTGAMYDYDYGGYGSAPWGDKLGEIKTVVIKNGVTRIGIGTFGDCYNLTSVTMPTSVKSIGDLAFMACFRLTSITIPQGVTSIGDSAFYDCYRLKTVNLSSSVKTIGEGAFFECGNLENVYYSGTKAQWKAINVKDGNYCLLSATIHYFGSSVAAPAAPVIKITTSSGKPKISWSAVDGATKYYIYRSTDGKTYKQYTTTTKTSYTNTNAKIGTTYYYKVKAAKVVNDKTVKSAYSNVKSIKCTPAAPVVSISRSNGKPKLTWKAVTGASKYYIYRSTDGKTYKQYTTTTKTTYTNTGAASGKKYYYKVKAVAVVNKKNVFSAYSTAKNLMTTIATPTVSITTANGKPKITWKAVTGADKYIVYRSTDGKTFKQLSTTTKTSLTNTGAKKNTKYYYKVKAVCTKNTSANSALSKAVSIKATK